MIIGVSDGFSGRETNWACGTNGEVLPLGMRWIVIEGCGGGDNFEGFIICSSGPDSCTAGNYLQNNTPCQIQHYVPVSAPM